MVPNPIDIRDSSEVRFHHKVAQATTLWVRKCFRRSRARRCRVWRPNNAEGRFTVMEWVSPDFEEVETSAEVTAYMGHW
jgi:coenzyme PQQ precursor peptide PqqA